MTTMRLSPPSSRRKPGTSALLLRGATEKALGPGFRRDDEVGRTS